MPAKHRVALVLKEAKGASGRDFLMGAFSYANTRPDWQILRGLRGSILTWNAALKLQPDGILGVLIDECLSAKDFPRGTKVVILNAYRWKHPFHRVVSDSAEAGRRAASHLLERHYRHFAYVGAEWADFSVQRRQGFEEALKKAGFPMPVPQMHDSELRQNPAAFRRWLSELPSPCGILCAQDDIGIRVIKQCQRIGLKVPEDVAVASVSNEELACIQLPVPLSSVAQNFQEVGYRAAAHLDALFSRQKGIAKTELVPPQEIVARDSTRTVGVTDPLVRRALSVIQDYYQEPLSVDELLGRLGKVSRRQLELKFNEVVGHGPHEEMVRCRVLHAQRLLRSTRLSMEEIAHRSGFYDSAHFCRHFKKRSGCTPTAYRKKCLQKLMLAPRSAG